jgi:hypothetical protein
MPVSASGRPCRETAYIALRNRFPLVRGARNGFPDAGTLTEWKKTFSLSNNKG